MSKGRGKTVQEYAELLREKLPPQFPGVQFAFNTGGIVTAALNFGLPSPIDIQSFVDPFIIMFAVPLGLIGVLATLFMTGTTLNVQSFMGVIFMVGISVSNNILLVEFAN